MTKRQTNETSKQRLKRMREQGFIRGCENNDHDFFVVYIPTTWSYDVYMVCRKCGMNDKVS
jgi:hypothetical protein